MKTAVETIFVGKERGYNRRFLETRASTTSSIPRRRHVASGWEKGQVENQVGGAGERFFTPRLRFKSYDELNAWLMEQVHRLRQGSSPSRALRAKPAPCSSRRSGPSWFPYRGRFDGFHAQQAAPCPKTCLVRFDNNKYSVKRERGRSSGRGPRLCRARRLPAPGHGRIAGEYPPEQRVAAR